MAQEIVHSMRNMKGRKGMMAIKVDLEKDYDRLQWDFISNTLSEAKLPSNLVTLIMKCIESTSINVLWNGNATVDFSPSRGIRQGDPLSPYIFVLCLERLSQLINKEVDQGSWRLFRIKRTFQNQKNWPCYLSSLLCR